jgi:hypothetical protein
VPVGSAGAQAESQAAPVNLPTTAPAAVVTAPAEAATSAGRFRVGVSFLPMLGGSVALGPTGSSTSYNLDAAKGLGLWFGYRIVAGLSVGIAPQLVFGLSAKDSAGYPLIDSEKEYDLMARIAYAYTVIPRLDVYAELLPGYSLVTYNDIKEGVQTPRAHGAVLGGGLGAAFDITGHLFVNAGIGYQVGFQKSHGISLRDVKTSFLRIALGVGVKF